MLIRTAPVALLASALAFAASGCKSATETGAAASGSAAAADSAAPAGTGAATAAAAQAPATAEATGAIAVKIVDFQLFHPASPDRTLAPIREDGTFSTRGRSPYYGLGLIVEAKNGTGTVLSAADFEALVTVKGSKGTAYCRVEADAISGGGWVDTKALGFYEKPRPANTPANVMLSRWHNEADSTNERPWRPGESVRMIGRTECDSAVMADIDASEIGGSVKVTAVRRFAEHDVSEYTKETHELSLGEDSVRIVDRKTSQLVVTPLKNIVEMKAEASGLLGAKTNLASVRVRGLPITHSVDKVESAPVALSLHPHALTLQLVKLASGEQAHAAGNVLVLFEKEKLVYRDLGKEKLSMLGLSRQDLPAKSPEVTVKVDEFTGSVTGAELTSFLDDNALEKGQRALLVAWKLSIASDVIDSRLRADVDNAKSANDKAEAAVGALGEGADAAASAAAKAEAAKTKAALTAAEAKYRSAATSERTRLARLISCGDVKVATTGREVAPSNAADVRAKCNELNKTDNVDVTLRYVLGRYEIPVALTYRVGTKATFSPIASAALTKLDPR